MTNINDIFPSKYVKATDLRGKDHSVVIYGVEEKVKVGRDEDEVTVLYFKGRKKGMILNRTNARTISSIHGPETDNWGDKAITLYSTEVEFGGNTTLGIRVRLTAPTIEPNNDETVPDESITADTVAESKDIDDSDIPF